MKPTLRKRKAEQQPAAPPLRRPKPSTKHKGTGDPGDPPRGKRLLPSVVDDIAKHAPDTVFASTGRSSGTFEDFTYAQLANAVDRTAQWLQSQASSQLQLRSTMAYLGPSDLRYIALILAALKVGIVMFLPSPHNPVEAQKELLRATSSQVLVCSKDFGQTGADVIADSEVPIAILPELAELFDDARIEHMPYEKKYAREKDQPFVILHTSGTTGTPKLVPLSHAYYAYEDLSQGQEYAGSITSAPFTAKPRCLTTAPMWHAGGIFFGLLKPILNQVVPVLPPLGLPITAEVADTCLKTGKIDILQAAPSLLADMSADARYVPSLKGLKHIIMSSGPMGNNDGDKLLSINANTLHFFGATETDLLPLSPLENPTTDWQYHHFHPLSGATFRKISVDMYELIIKQVPNAVQPYFSCNPKGKEFSTKDVFSPHPTKSNLWTFDCRLDDIITFSTGEKMNPTTFEAAISGPGTFTLIVGQGRKQPALLVCMVRSPASAWLDSMWPRIEAANA
ncbi:hypothetical protein DOTSEDRAFT_137074, partial [Dothistroma septosporum NZE10]